MEKKRKATATRTNAVAASKAKKKIHRKKTSKGINKLVKSKTLSSKSRKSKKSSKSTRLRSHSTSPIRPLIGRRHLGDANIYTGSLHVTKPYRFRPHNDSRAPEDLLINMLKRQIQMEGHAGSSHSYYVPGHSNAHKSHYKSSSATVSKLTIRSPETQKRRLDENSRHPSPIIQIQKKKESSSINLGIKLKAPSKVSYADEPKMKTSDQNDVANTKLSKIEESDNNVEGNTENVQKQINEPVPGFPIKISHLSVVTPSERKGSENSTENVLHEISNDMKVKSYHSTYLIGNVRTSSKTNSLIDVMKNSNHENEMISNNKPSAVILADKKLGSSLNFKLKRELIPVAEIETLVQHLTPSQIDILQKGLELSKQKMLSASQNRNLDKGSSTLIQAIIIAAQSNQKIVPDIQNQPLEKQQSLQEYITRNESLQMQIELSKQELLSVLESATRLKEPSALLLKSIESLRHQPGLESLDFLVSQGENKDPLVQTDTKNTEKQILQQELILSKEKVIISPENLNIIQNPNEHLQINANDSLDQNVQQLQSQLPSKKIVKKESAVEPKNEISIQGENTDPPVQTDTKNTEIQILQQEMISSKEKVVISPENLNINQNLNENLQIKSNDLLDQNVKQLQSQLPSKVTIFPIKMSHLSVVMPSERASSENSTENVLHEISNNMKAKSYHSTYLIGNVRTSSKSNSLIDVMQNVNHENEIISNDNLSAVILADKKLGSSLNFKLKRELIPEAEIETLVQDLTVPQIDILQKGLELSKQKMLSASQNKILDTDPSTLIQAIIFAAQSNQKVVPDIQNQPLEKELSLQEYITRNESLQMQIELSKQELLSVLGSAARLKEPSALLLKPIESLRHQPDLESCVLLVSQGENKDPLVQTDTKNTEKQILQQELILSKEEVITSHENLNIIQNPNENLQTNSNDLLDQSFQQLQSQLPSKVTIKQESAVEPKKEISILGQESLPEQKLSILKQEQQSESEKEMGVSTENPIPEAKNISIPLEKKISEFKVIDKSNEEREEYELNSLIIGKKSAEVVYRHDSKNLLSELIDDIMNKIDDDDFKAPPIAKSKSDEDFIVSKPQQDDQFVVKSKESDSSNQLEFKSCECDLKKDDNRIEIGVIMKDDSFAELSELESTEEFYYNPRYCKDFR